MPECTYPSCSASTAVPYAIKTKQKECPNIQQCLIVTSVNNQGQINGDVTIIPDVKCTQNVTDPSGTTPGGLTPPSSGGGNEDNENDSFSFWELIGVFLVFCFLLVLFYWIFKKLTSSGTSDSKKSSGGGGTAAIN